MSTPDPRRGDEPGDPNVEPAPDAPQPDDERPVGEPGGLPDLDDNPPPEPDDEAP